MKTLSIFIDESGDFGEVKELPSYYLVSFVLHNQNDSIVQDVNRLEQDTKNSGFDIEYIHTGPIIRRESVFLNYSLDERRKLLYKMLNFYIKLPVSHFTVKVDRKEARDKISLSGCLAKSIRNEILNHESYFHQFDKIIVYYDYGQSELSAVLNAVFSLLLSNVEFRKAEPQKYRLLQVADFVCSFELLKLKNAEKRLSKSEEKFFYKPQELKKTFIKAVDKKHI